MSKRIFIYILALAAGGICTACVRGSSTSTVVETNVTESTERQTVKEKESLPEPPTETENEYSEEINTVESLEDDGRKMSAAEALRSAMKGKHSALELTRDERFFILHDGNEQPYYVKEIKDMPIDGLKKIDLHKYNRGAGGISPIWAEAWVKWEKFICVDMDQDGTKEVLLDGDAIDVVLYYKDGEVYMAETAPRAFPSIVYENGIFLTSGGIYSVTHNRLYTAKGAVYREWVAFMDDNTELVIDTSVYKIMNKEVTKEEYEVYIEELVGGLTPLEWHDFTEENIDRYVVD